MTSPSTVEHGHQPRIGSLFSGAGMLDVAVAEVLGGETAWPAEVEPAACLVLDRRFPDVPNLGDVTTVDWSVVEPVDVICGGSPCQDVSAAGKRAGMRAGTRSGLWASMCDAIDILRPSLVVWENVRGALSAEADSAMEPCTGCVGDGDDGPVLRALGRVLGDLAEFGYDTRWHGLRAADVGAPHGRYRIFVVAWPADAQPLGRRQGWAASKRTNGAHGQPRGRGDSIPADTHGNSLRQQSVGERRGCSQAVAGHAREGSASDTESIRRGEGRSESAQFVGGRDVAECGDGAGPAAHPSSCRWRANERDLRARQSDVAWGGYEPAIRQWERVLGRVAPHPTSTGQRGGQQLSARFDEWVMGWPDGWVTEADIWHGWKPSAARNAQIKLCGNGVVPQQAAEALRRLLSASAVAA